MKTTSLRTLRSAAALAIATLLGFIGAASARELDSFTFRLENDFISGSDEYYTGGSEFLFAYQPYEAKNDNNARIQNSLALGQLIFTPRDTEVSASQPYDQPYAGWSYLRYGRHRSKNDRFDSWQLTLGLVGPSSFAEDIQRSIHDLIGNSQSQGWDNQLSDEFGYILERRRSANRLAIDFGNERTLQFSEETRLALGNIDTSISQSILLRFGKNLPTNPTVDRIGAPPTEAFSKSSFAYVPLALYPKRGYWILGAKSAYVAENYFIEGDTPYGKHFIDKNDFVHELEAGYVYSKPGFKFSLTVVYQTEQFRQQEGGHTFGSFAFSFRR